jgi:hypothetical protein
MEHAPAYRVTLVGTGAFVALVVLAHPLRPELPPADHFVSEYAVGPGGWVQTLAFICWAAGLGAAAALAAGLPLGPGRRGRWARALAAGFLVVAAVGAVLCAAFETQTIGGVLPEGVDRTAEGRLHDLGSLLVLGGIVVAALAAARLLSGRYRWLIGAFALAFFAWPALLVMLGADAPGVGQRGLIALGCAWTVAFAVAAARAAVTRPAR